jgi:hypothetical protein
MSLSTPNANGSAIPSPVSLRKSQWFPSNVTAELLCLRITPWFASRK